MAILNLVLEGGATVSIEPHERLNANNAFFVKYEGNEKKALDDFGVGNEQANRNRRNRFIRAIDEAIEGRVSVESFDDEGSLVKYSNVPAVTNLYGYKNGNRDEIVVIPINKIVYLTITDQPKYK